MSESRSSSNPRRTTLSGFTSDRHCFCSCRRNVVFPVLRIPITACALLGTSGRVASLRVAEKADSGSRALLKSSLGIICRLIRPPSAGAESVLHSRTGCYHSVFISRTHNARWSTYCELYDWSSNFKMSCTYNLGHHTILHPILSLGFQLRQHY